MPRNVDLQILRGIQANMPTLNSGEFYFATDTSNLFIELPGFGPGYIQVADMTGVNETLQQMLLEVRAMKAATVTLACEGARAMEDDFDVQQVHAGEK
jgi:hypothetical protein